MLATRARIVACFELPHRGTTAGGRNLPSCVPTVSTTILLRLPRMLLLPTHSSPLHPARVQKTHFLYIRRQNVAPRIKIEMDLRSLFIVALITAATAATSDIPFLTLRTTDYQGIPLQKCTSNTDCEFNDSPLLSPFLTLSGS